MTVIRQRGATNPALFQFEEENRRKQKSLAATHCSRGMDSCAGREKPVALRLRGLNGSACASWQVAQWRHLALMTQPLNEPAGQLLAGRGRSRDAGALESSHSYRSLNPRPLIGSLNPGSDFV